MTTKSHKTLVVVGVEKSYNGVPALRGVDIAVDAGQIVGLLGPNGAGKTSLISIVAGLRRPDAGTVHVAGIDVLKHPQRARHHLGLAPQDLGIYVLLSVRENLTVFAELAGLRRRALSERIDEVATALALTELMGRQAARLSGGEKRRLHTAMALLHKPQLLLLDEPTTGADVASRARLLSFVRDLAADGAAIVYSTHYLPEIEHLGASVTLLDHGHVLARGTVDELVTHYARSSVELTFDGPAPHISLNGSTTVDGPLLRVQCDDPAATAASLLQSLGEDAWRLKGVEIVRPSLETVFLAITGRRYDAEGDVDPSGEEAHVPIA